jgi:hypothetical protein
MFMVDLAQPFEASERKSPTGIFLDSAILILKTYTPCTTRGGIFRIKSPLKGIKGKSETFYLRGIQMRILSRFDALDGQKKLHFRLHFQCGKLGVRK